MEDPYTKFKHELNTELYKYFEKIIPFNDIDYLSVKTFVFIVNYYDKGLTGKQTFKEIKRIWEEGGDEAVLVSKLLKSPGYWLDERYKFDWKTGMMFLIVIVSGWLSGKYILNYLPYSLTELGPFIAFTPLGFFVYYFITIYTKLDDIKLELKTALRQIAGYEYGIRKEIGN